jgi:purine-cytosine permease-like protein
VAGFPSWFVVPYLIFAIVQLFAINTLDLYSSGVTLQSLTPGLHRIGCVAIDTVICGAVAAYAVFSSDFLTLLTSFLLFIILWLAPWCAIYLVDSWLRRNRYDSRALLNESGGRYFRNGGFHWPALTAQIAGGVAAALWLNAFSETSLTYEGPLASRIGGPFGSDFSVFIGLIVAGRCARRAKIPRPQWISCDPPTRYWSSRPCAVCRADRSGPAAWSHPSPTGGHPRTGSHREGRWRGRLDRPCSWTSCCLHPIA